MSHVPDGASARFARLAKALAEGTGRADAHREGFGTGSLFVGRKMFGLLDDSGALVVKLPPERVKTLISEGTGRPWHPGNGRPLKEYVAIGFDRQALWLKLAKEAREYMRTK